MKSSKHTIAVCGGGLAGNMTARSLAQGLGEDYRLVQIISEEASPQDAFYGHATDPGAYNFLRRLGLDEPTLFLRTATAFSYGTHFRTWLASRSWMQCHHSPFRTVAGIPLHHHLTRSGKTLEPLLVSAQAALAGRFAHPPADPKIALSQAEYGYQFDPMEWTRLLDGLIAESRVTRLRAELASVETEDGQIGGLILDSGERIEADLYIDASGLSRRVALAAGGAFQAGRTVGVRGSTNPSDTLGPPCRIVDIDTDGWSVTAHLQNALHRLEIGAAEAETADGRFTVELGSLTEAWTGNCIAVGQAASVFEPLTPAPMMMLQRDLERLLELIPVQADMAMECREFNRRFREDVVHTTLFHDALLMSDAAPDSTYWRNAVSPDAPGPKLDRKLAQFENRGLLTGYDLEPFNEEDWVIAHLGMGRRPTQHDRQMDRVPESETAQALTGLERDIKQLVPQMPPHPVYVTKLKQYLEKKNHV